MPQISCILLAAGKSTRMGKKNKLLLEFNNTPLVRRVCERLMSISDCETIVVTGYQHEEIKSSLKNLGVKIVLNTNYEKGMLSSIKQGILSIDQESQGFFVCLADCPFINPTIMQQMIKKIKEELGKIIVPTHKNLRGNPVLISKDFIPEILSHHDADHGCYFLLKKYPQKVHKLLVSDKKVFFDIDNISDYEKLSKLQDLESKNV